MIDSKRMRLISWNVAGRVGRLREQVAALACCDPDVVALQEITVTTAQLLPSLLHAAGLVHVQTSLDLPCVSVAGSCPPRAPVLIASRWPFHILPLATFDLPWPQCALSAEIYTPWRAIELHAVHVPPGSTYGWRKVETFEGVYQALARPSPHHRILCGDFNSPKDERPDGTIVPFRPGIVRWARAELSVVRDLAAFDLADVYRSLHGYGVQEFSWFWRGRGRSIGRRFDHVFASQSLNPVVATYLHGARESGLSDHSPIEVCFEPIAILRRGGT